MQVIALEEWKSIPEFDGYEVSDLGRVRGPQKMMKTTIRKDGYVQLVLRTTSKKQKALYLHRLVACAFVANPDGLPEVNHKDLNKSNCQASNLEWNTQAQNILHASAAGKKLNGAYTKLSPEMAAEIRAKWKGTYRKDVNLRTLAKDYGVSRSMIWYVINGQNWKSS